MTAADIFNSKTANNEGEHDGVSLVSQHTMSGGALVVAIGVEAFLEKLVGENSGQQKSVKAATNFKVDPAVADMVGEVIFYDKFFRDV